MESFLPSEIGRLIYGYLFQQCGEQLADEFLNSCDSMRECRILKQKYAKNFHFKVQDLSLEDILNQYSMLCPLIFKNTDEEPVHQNVLHLLQKMLISKFSHFYRRSRKNDNLPVSSNDRSASETKNRSDSIDDCDIVFSPSNVDVEGNSEIPIDQNLIPNYSTNAVEEPVAKLYRSFHGTSSFCTEHRNHSTFDYSTPSPKSTEKISTKATSSTTDNGAKNTNSSFVTLTNRPTTVMKSIENVSKNRTTVTESSEAAKLVDCAAIRRKSFYESGKKDKKRLPACRSSPRKSSVASTNSVTGSLTKIVTTSPSVVSKSTDTVFIPSNVPKITSTITTSNVSDVLAKSISQDEISSLHAPTVPIASLTVTQEVNYSDKPTIKDSEMLIRESSLTTVPTISKVNDILSTTFPIVDALETTINSAQEAAPSAPIVNSSILERIANVFGEPSFTSDCNMSGHLDESSSNVKSISDSVIKEKSLEVVRESTPEKTNVNNPPMNKLTPRKSEGIVCASVESTPRKLVENDYTSIAICNSTNEIIKTNSFDKGSWDSKLRLTTIDSSDANISKRKPKNSSRSKKQKETPKKRKYDDLFEEMQFDSSKRYKSDLNSTTAGSTRLKSVHSEFDKITALKCNSPSKRQTANGDGIFLENTKFDRPKNKYEPKTVASPFTSSTKPFVSMTDIIDFDNSLIESRENEPTEKAKVVEKKRRQSKNSKKPSNAEPKELLVARNSKSSPLIDDEINNPINESKMEKIKKDVKKKNHSASKEQHNILDLKKSAFQEPNPSSFERAVLGSKNFSLNNNTHKSMEVENCDNLICANTIEKAMALCQPSISVYDPDFEMVLEVTKEIVLFDKRSKC